MMSWLKHFHGSSTAVIAEGIVYIDCLASYTLHTKSVLDENPVIIC